MHAECATEAIIEGCDGGFDFDGGELDGREAEAR
jgi:hypothetical protein